NTDGDNPSKYLLYQDVLLGLFDKQIKGLQLGEHYKKLYEAIFLEETMKNYELFKYYSLLAKLLSLKAELGIQIQEAYQKKD
ncbi:MAG: beta-N-acetylhexosaminidase, partial [Acetivibrio sp.]